MTTLPSSLWKPQGIVVSRHSRTTAAATVITAVVDDPTGYGRIVRNGDGEVERVGVVPERLEIDVAGGLAAAHQRSQVHVEQRARSGERLHHHLQRRGKQERVAHRVLLQGPQPRKRLARITDARARAGNGEPVR